MWKTILKKLLKNTGHLGVFYIYKLALYGLSKMPVLLISGSLVAVRESDSFDMNRGNSGIEFENDNGVFQSLNLNSYLKIN